MPPVTRTFVALPLGEAAVEALIRLRTRLAPEAPKARWVAAENLHVTLAFLGGVSPAELPGVIAATHDAAAAVPLPQLNLRGLGAFPEARRPRVLWAGLEGDVEALAAMQRDLAARLRAAGLAPDPRFSPHVTLARFDGWRRRRPPDLTPILAEFAGWTGGPLDAPEIVVFASELRSEGPVYTPLARAPFAPATSPDGA
jgi:2'-5' RNA ligase